MSKAKKASRLLLSVFVSTFILAIISISPCAASSTLKEISTAEKQSILERFKILHKDVHAILASVIQEKQLVALKKKIVVEGTVTMSKPNMLKWEVAKPERSMTVIDGETMTVYHPDVKEAQIFVLSENLIARNAMSFFSTAMGGDIAEMEQKFKVNIFRNDSEVVFRLSPTSKLVGKYLSAVLIFYDEKTALPRGFEMLTPKGDRTFTHLSNIKVNPELSPETFNFHLPADVWVTNKVEPRNN
ncbi:MAG TPA: outer membrane lipoprotein carrier protein LolA [Dissulfurispiraceae bacterium]|nr:outer membrane lipoprotein carrier protein LolA [Dissulfurispiraceae bacterium]